MMNNGNTRRGFTQIKWVGQAGPALQPCQAGFDNAPAKWHLSAVKQNCHPEFISGSTPLVTIQYKEEMLGPRIKTLRGAASGNAAVQHDMRSKEMLKLFHETPYYNLTGLGPKVMASVQHDNRIGFTLIELLVVVLIIGILAAVAVPQYKQAVLKSRWAKLKPLVASLVEAERVYYLANGSYTTNLTQLDVGFEWEQVTISGLGPINPFYKAPTGEYCTGIHGYGIGCFMEAPNLTTLSNGQIELPDPAESMVGYGVVYRWSNDSQGSNGQYCLLANTQVTAESAKICHKLIGRNNVSNSPGYWLRFYKID